MATAGSDKKPTNYREDWRDVLSYVRMTNVKQPWAEAIFRFGKNYENRAARCPDRGWMLIIASKGVGRRAEWEEAIASLRTKIEAHTSDPDKQPYRAEYLHRLDGMVLSDFPRGGIVGAVYVYDSLQPPHLYGWGREPGMAFSMGRKPTSDTCVGAPWRDLRRHSWRISRVIPFDDVIPLKGSQSTYRYFHTHKDYDKVIEAVLDRLEQHDPERNGWSS